MYREIQNGRTSVKHEERVGRPSTSNTDEKTEAARQILLTNRRITIDEVASFLQISHDSAFHIIYDKFGFHKVYER